MNDLTDYDVSYRLRYVQVFIDDFEVYNFSASPSAVTTITDNLPRTGNRVRLQKVNDNISAPILNICEVQVLVQEIYCGSRPCANGGTCTEGVNTYSCSCTKEYTGTNCTLDINECYLHSSLCLPGNCSNTNGSFYCTCPSGYIGTNNCTDINECEMSNRHCNNGSCINIPGSFSCDCQNGYTGETCNKEIDECASSPCANGGTCIDAVASYKCNCPCDYTGFDCSGSAMIGQSSQNYAGPILGGFFGGVVFATCIWIVGFCFWKRRNSPSPTNSPSTNNKHHSRSLEDTATYYNITMGTCHNGGLIGATPPRLEPISSFWKRRNSPSTTNKQQSGSLPDSPIYYNTANVDSEESPGARKPETRQEVRRSADGCEVGNDSYDKLHPYSNDVTLDAATYRSLNPPKKI